MKKPRYRPADPIGSKHRLDETIPTPLNRWDNLDFSNHRNRADILRDAAKLPIKSGDEISLIQKKWLFNDWIEQGQLTLIAGLPSTGKSTLTCALAAAVTRGSAHELFPGFKATDSGYVIFICREDDIHKSLTARLQAAGADMKKIKIISSRFSNHNEAPFSISNPRDRIRLAALPELINNDIHMIVIDPIYQAVNGDFNSNYKAREAYEGLTELAQQLECAIVGICHSVKSPRSKDALARISGPQAIREVPRSIILLSEIMGPPTHTGGTHVMIHAKNNEGSMLGGYEYCLVPCCIKDGEVRSEQAVFEISGQLSGRPHEILEWADEKPEGIKTRKETKKDYAKGFLLTILERGEMCKADIVASARNAEITEGTLLLAKSELPITTRKRKGDGRSVWHLAKEIDGGYSKEATVDD